jgi:hypothetical protein
MEASAAATPAGAAGTGTGTGTGGVGDGSGTPTKPRNAAGEEIDRILAARGEGKLQVRSRAALKAMGQYIWPVGETGLRARTVAAVGLLIAAKLMSVQVPLFFKVCNARLSDTAAHVMSVVCGCSMRWTY